MKMLIVQKKRHHNAEMLRERDELEIYLLGELKPVFVSSELSFVLEYNNPWSQTRNKEHRSVCSTSAFLYIPVLTCSFLLWSREDKRFIQREPWFPPVPASGGYGQSKTHQDQHWWGLMPSSERWGSSFRETLQAYRKLSKTAGERHRRQVWVAGDTQELTNSLLESSVPSYTFGKQDFFSV